MSWILLLSILGIILVCLEMFLPGMVIGTAGATCLALAVAVTYAKFGADAGNMALAALAIASALGMVAWLFVFPRTRSGRSMITHRDLASSKSADALDALLGQEGEALTLLRPAGTVRLGGRRVDAVAETGLIPQGARVKVIRVEGNRVFVRNAGEPAS
jgi:membrane-bound serine protease (ClpP class)